MDAMMGWVGGVVLVVLERCLWCLGGDGCVSGVCGLRARLESVGCGGSVRWEWGKEKAPVLTARGLIRSGCEVGLVGYETI